MDTGVAVAKEGPITKPVCAAVNDPKAQFFDEAEGFRYLRGPHIGRWNLTELRPLVHASDCDSNRPLSPVTHELS
jgi:hypothetical protein